MTKSTLRVMKWRRENPEAYKILKARENRKRLERRNKVVNDYKLAHPCACGESDIACLDFHHQDPATKRKRLNGNAQHISHLHTIRAILEEIKKCEVLCANCHRKGHAGRPRPEHIPFFPKNS